MLHHSQRAKEKIILMDEPAQSPHEWPDLTSVYENIAVDNRSSCKSF